MIHMENPGAPRDPFIPVTLLLFLAKKKIGFLFFGFLRKNLYMLLIILYLQLVPVRLTLVFHLPSLLQRERQKERSWKQQNTREVLMVSRSLVSSLCRGFCATLTPGRAQADGAPKACAENIPNLLILPPLPHNSGWNTLRTTQWKTSPWSANTRTGNSQHLRAENWDTRQSLDTSSPPHMLHSAGVEQTHSKVPFFHPLLTWAMGPSQELRLHRRQESSHLCLKQNQPTLSCRNSICASPKRDGKSLIIKPIAFSRWPKKSTFKKLPRGL